MLGLTSEGIGKTLWWVSQDCRQSTIFPEHHFSANSFSLRLGEVEMKDYKQLLGEFFVISWIIKVEVRLITLTETLIIPDITKTASNNCFIILYLQVISQFLAGSMKRIEKPFLLRSPRTWHWCPCSWHCSWKSCIARATYRLFTNL